MIDPSNTVKVFDEFLPKQDFLSIKGLFLSNSFPWYLNKVIPLEYEGVVEPIKNTTQFTHVFYQDYAVNSPHFSVLSPLINKISPVALLRVKANLLPKSDTIVEEHGYHTDFPDTVQNLTSVFYLNTNNGYTKFEDGTRIDSVENRLVVFNNSLKHTGSTCTDAETRCVLNINYIGGLI
jgi:hypothetical protein